MQLNRDNNQKQPVEIEQRDKLFPVIFHVIRPLQRAGDYAAIGNLAQVWYIVDEQHEHT